jgi:hypothetical protein
MFPNQQIRQHCKYNKVSNLKSLKRLKSLKGSKSSNAHGVSEVSEVSDSSNTPNTPNTPNTSNTSNTSNGYQETFSITNVGKKYVENRFNGNKLPTEMFDLLQIFAMLRNQESKTIEGIRQFILECYNTEVQLVNYFISIKAEKQVLACKKSATISFTILEQFSNLIGQMLSAGLIQKHV